MYLKIIDLREKHNHAMFQRPECQELIHTYSEFYPDRGYQPPWVGYFIILEYEVVGSCGFTGPPVDGKVEIAYWTFEAFEGRGIASFACKELLAISKKADPLLKIFAKTAPEENTSTRILKKNNFQFIKVVEDHEIGDAWQWEYSPKK